METRAKLIEQGATPVYKSLGAGFRPGAESEAGLMLNGVLYIAPKNEYGHSSYLGEIWNPDHEVFRVAD